MFLLLVATCLFLSVKASHFNISIEKVNITSNNETYKFCNSRENCIEYISICIQQICKNSSSGVFSNYSFEISGKEIQVLPSIKMLDYDILQFDKSKVYSVNERVLFFRNDTFNVSIQLYLTVNCQNDFLPPFCSEIDLCDKVPTGMCQNQGSCVQKNSRISCKCNGEFTGNFCQEKINPCHNNLCSNNSTCRGNPSAILNYECLCPSNFYGKLCENDVNECLNETICSHLPNATCINIYGSYICQCTKECRTITTTTLSSTTILDPTTPFFIKWPLKDMHTLILVSLEAAIIVTLILVLIFINIKCCPIKKKKSKFLVDDTYLFSKLNDNKKKKVEYDSNYIRQPIISDDKHQSLVPMYDIQELENTFNNLPSNSPGMSTFGRR